jgi:hypothetical protein
MPIVMQEHDGGQPWWPGRDGPLVSTLVPTMNGFEHYLIPYISSQLVAIGLLAAAFHSTRLARLLLGIIFLAASAFNLYTGLTDPAVYLNYAPMAIPLYREFILGWFSEHSHVLIPMIAAGQFLVGIGMLLKGWWVKWACIGCILFLLGIAPLMVGSAFPFSLIVSWAAAMILLRDPRLPIWHGNKTPTKIISVR